ncbi:MAG: DUF4326 domain-containing protein [Cyanosarcina radialis HA8281-LM2]|jgi:hypothetical protein|nr:DUF4326 domain-containing protein [Cyanosarcina radialis HA8281-LM2]
MASLLGSLVEIGFISALANRFYGLRESVLGNPFAIGKEGNREEVIEKYRQWLWANVKSGLQGNHNEVFDELVRIGEMMLEGKDVELSCYCVPLKCHGDVIVRCVEWMIQAEIIVRF